MPCRPRWRRPLDARRKPTTMLTFQDHFQQAGRWQRRQFLRAGALALGGLTLGDNFAVRAAAGGEKNPFKDRSVIFLFMHGGPSHGRATVKRCSGRAAR